MLLREDIVDQALELTNAGTMRDWEQENHPENPANPKEFNIIIHTHKSYNIYIYLYTIAYVYVNM
jgi:hypothetical protein